MTQRSTASARARGAVRVTCIVVAAAAVLAGCLHRRNHRPRPSRPESFATLSEEVTYLRRATPSRRPWFCNSVGNGTPHSGHGNGSHVHPVYEGKTKGPLSWDDCAKLAAELDTTIAATKGFETKAKGEAAGWRQVASYIPGLGTHHAKVSGFGGMPPGSIPPGSVPPGTRPGLDTAAITRCLADKGINVTGGMPNFSDPAFVEALRACGVPLPPGGTIPGFGSTTFDPASPQFLIYGGPQDDAPLTGVAFAFIGADTPPEAYTGGNDWWHLHSKVCYSTTDRRVLAGAEEISDEECTRLGGRNQALNIPGLGGSVGIWLLHVWLPPYEYRPDLFASGHNCLLDDGVAADDDPCWTIARRDPSLGTPPTTGEDSHGHGHGPVDGGPPGPQPSTTPPTTMTDSAPDTKPPDPPSTSPSTGPATTHPPDAPPADHGDHGHDGGGHGH